MIRFFYSIVIRKAEYADIPAVMKAVNEGKEWLRSQNVDQWQNGYPNENVIREDIALQSGYVYDEEGTARGYCFIRAMEDPCYRVIVQGQWKNDRPYIVLHRTCISKDLKGKGAAGAFVRFAQDMAKEAGILDLRADTHRDNRSMRRMLEKNGFEACGTVFMQDGSERIAYQKVLD